MEKQSYTAFPETERGLKNLVQRIDRESFERFRVVSCSDLFSRCHGICCSTKVAVTPEEADVISSVAKAGKDFFENNGIRLPKDLFKTDALSGRKVIAKRRRSLAELYRIMQGLNSKEPLRIMLKFTRTCIFACADGACSLQRLSKEEGRHKWYYKPINCWKFPISIDQGRLAFCESYEATYFPCAMSKEKGHPAKEALREEIDFLSCLLGQKIA